MNYFSYVLLVVSLLSFWETPLVQFANGTPWLMTVATVGVLLWDIVYKFYVRVKFIPDIIITTDPLMPNPKPIVDGITAALSMCKNNNQKVNLAISYTIGANMLIKLHTGKSECCVEIQSEAGHVEYSRKIPTFSLGENPSIFSLTEYDNLLLVVRPPKNSKERARIELLNRNTIKPFLITLVSLAIASSVFSWRFAVSLLFGAAFRFAFDKATNINSITDVSIPKAKMLLIHLTAIGIIIFNLYKSRLL